MTRAIVICCDKADDVLLPALTVNLRAVYPDAELLVAPCAVHPPQTLLPLTSPLRWNSSYIASDILRALYEAGGDRVAKIDADTWHTRPYLFESRAPMSGIQWAQNPHNILGIGYTLTRSAIIELMAMEPCAQCNRTKEDQVISWAARKAFPNGVHMYPVGTARKASTYAGQNDCCVVHLGCDADRTTRHRYQQLFARPQ